MKNINYFWTSLVVLGVIILFITAVWNISQSLSGFEGEFKEEIKQLPDRILVPKYLEDHLLNADKQNQEEDIN